MTAPAATAERTRLKAPTRALKAEPKPAIDIVEAMNAKELFEPWFRGVSWNGWRTVLKAAYALPMTDAEIEFFRTVAERDPPTKRVKELWIGVGRRGGKDSIASVIAAHSAALFDQSNVLRPGERAVVMCLASDKDQARIILNYTRAFFADVPLLTGMIQRETASGFELTNKVDVSILTNNFKAVRGRPVLCAILDEIAFWRDENSANPDDEVYKAIKPALASLPGSMIIGISSPYRKGGLLYAKYKQHFGKDDDKVLFIRAPTRALNPTIDQNIIDQALVDDPASAKAEWLGEFRNDIGGWLSAEVIEAAIDTGITVRPPRRDLKYVSFCDPSGGVRDSFTAAVAHLENDVAILDCLLEVKAPFNPSEATATIAAMLKQYNLRDTTGDKYAAAWVTDGFARQGINYRHSERDRSAIYLDVMPAFNSGRIRLVDNRRMITQFANLERRTSPVGKDRVNHGPGGHDDLCNSAAGALVLATTVKPMRFAPPIVITRPRDAQSLASSMRSEFHRHDELF